MAAPERFAQMSDFPLAPRAPSIHGTTRPLHRSLESAAIQVKRTPERSRTIAIGPAGGDLAERLLLRGWPRSLGVRAFLMSGDTAPERLREAQESGNHLLHKPVRPMRLRAMVNQMLKMPEVAGAS